MSGAVQRIEPTELRPLLELVVAGAQRTAPPAVKFCVDFRREPRVRACQRQLSELLALLLESTTRRQSGQGANVRICVDAGMAIATVEIDDRPRSREASWQAVREHAASLDQCVSLATAAGGALHALPNLHGGFVTRLVLPFEARGADDSHRPQLTKPKHEGVRIPPLAPPPADLARSLHDDPTSGRGKKNVRSEP